MRAAEGRKKVIERAFVGNVDGSPLRTPLVPVAVEKVVMPESQIKQVAGRNAGRVVVIARRTWRGYCEQSRSISRRIFAHGERRGKRGALVPTEQSSLQLLIRRKNSQIHRPSIGDRNRPRHQTAVISPVEADPRPACPGLILQVSRLVELLVVIDAEGASTLTHGHSQPPDLRRKEARRDAGENHERAETVNIRDAHAARESGNLGVVPGNREEYRCVSQDAEVVSTVRVLPDVFSRKDEIFSERLLQSGVEFVAPPGTESRRNARHQ